MNKRNQPEQIQERMMIINELFLVCVLIAFTISPQQLQAQNQSPSAIRFLPDGRPASLVLDGKDRLNVENPGDGFLLRIFDGVTVHEERLSQVSRTADQLTVTKEGGIPRVTFRVVEMDRYISLHLVRIEGMPRDRGVSLGFSVRVNSPVEVVELDPMTTLTGRGSALVINWPYLWHDNPDDPFGAIALHAVDNEIATDLALASIWANEPLPRPAGQASWTEKDVMKWVDAYRDKFAGLSEITLSASTSEELYFLTEKAMQANIRRIYLHCDTWRGEYWPRFRSHVDVNPAVFPGGRADLVKYAEYLHDHGMLLRLHNVSGGIGWHDPQRVVSGIDRGMANWGGGTLESSIRPDDREILFRPAPGTEVPIHDRRHRRLFDNMAVNYVRIGEEIIKVDGFADLDRPVWRLLGCQRGQGGTKAVAHPMGTEGAGLYVPYHQNLIPDLDSPLLTEIAAEYADLVNEAKLDHLHFDGLEIHAHHPWGRDKFSSLVYARVAHPTTSSTSGGRPITANFEMRFSAIRAMRELDYHGVLIPILLADHREATGMLDTHFVIQAMLQLGTRRVVLQKPEPMFGITRDILEKHGLASDVFKLAGDWVDLLPRFDDYGASVLDGYMSRINSEFRQGGSHFESPDVLVLEKDNDAYVWVPTRVMTRQSGDVVWRFGQEHGAIGPRQYVQPGEIVRLDNPYETQTPHFIIHVLSECVEAAGKASLNAIAGQGHTIEDDYAAGAERAGQVREDGPASFTDNIAALQPVAAEVENQRFATFEQDGKGVIIHAENPTAKPIWTTDLPMWYRRASLSQGRGLAMDVTGDGSGAVLVITLDGHGRRDYVVKIDFTGRREIVIPNGEVAWANGHWGYRFSTKKFDYNKSIRAVHMGLGYIAPETQPSVRVANLRVLRDQPSELRDPVVRVGDGSLRISGNIRTGEYIHYSGGDIVRIHDQNWNHKVDLPVEDQRFVISKGETSVQVEVANQSSRPWITTQFITRGKPVPLMKQLNKMQTEQ